MTPPHPAAYAAGRQHDAQAGVHLGGLRLASSFSCTARILDLEDEGEGSERLVALDEEEGREKLVGLPLAQLDALLDVALPSVGVPPARRLDLGSHACGRHT